MIQEIQIVQDKAFKKLNLIISDITKDLECDEYFGYHFKLDQFNIKFRKAKVTPKKIGQFVTLWKRNPETKETEPFQYNDDFDFYIIYTEHENHQGFFLFSKKALIQHQILTTESKEGKRGFRVYPDWDIPVNKQAIKTQNWQQKSLINLSENSYLEKLQNILNSEI
ncbi:MULTISPECIES: MepB family protein [unclassified Chryseobacterium]|uniref:MepB family protein n=1 Tax=unclassified Chryseobacterium TaxID=2593645 RepID=UPI00226A3932|nr:MULTISPECIES: MepB family protein [unclassified Chryseobacterium]